MQTAVSSIPSSSRGWIHGPGNDGFIKLIADAGMLIGATSAGPSGGDGQASVRSMLVVMSIAPRRERATGQ